MKEEKLIKQQQQILQQQPFVQHIEVGVMVDRNEFLLINFFK